MGWFKSGKQEGPDLATLIMQGESMIEQLAQAHMTWGLGTADRWGLDQTTGLITWTFQDKTATASAQILGSHNPSTGTWLWAWANSSILPAMSRDSLVVRDWGASGGHHAFTEPKLDVDPEQAGSLTAVAVRITRATGFYRATGGASVPIITFGPVTLTNRDGTASTFKIAID